MAYYPNLPTLTGSEKQIAWATDIRAAALIDVEAKRAQIDAFAELLRTTPVKGTPADIDAKIAAAIAALDGVMAQASSKWWIEHKAGGPVLAASQSQADPMVRLILERELAGK